MSELTDLARLPICQLVAATGLFLPGFVSLKIDRLIHPGEDPKGPELLVEALGYSLINAALLSFAIRPALAELGHQASNPAFLWAYAVLFYVAGPAIWPVTFRELQRFASRRGWVLGANRYAWDDVFLRKEAYWVIVHLKDGGLVGGYFGQNSRASLGAQSGHIYLEELWHLTDDGAFDLAKGDSRGALFRPEDYLWIELIADTEEMH